MNLNMCVRLRICMKRALTTFDVIERSTYLLDECRQQQQEEKLRLIQSIRLCNELNARRYSNFCGILFQFYCFVTLSPNR